MSNTMVLAAGTIDLASSWEQVWGAVKGAIGSKLTTLLSAVGVILVVGALFKWLFERRRGGGGAFSGQASSGLLWTLAAGATLAAPGVLIPIFLTILDAIANAVIGLWDTSN